MENENNNLNNVEEDVFFDYVDANGVTKKGEVLTIFNVDGFDKTYALCSVPSDDGMMDIMTFIVNNNNPEEVAFDDIIDENELSVVKEATAKILNR